jgi:hypothetical protein
MPELTVAWRAQTARGSTCRGHGVDAKLSCFLKLRMTKPPADKRFKGRETYARFGWLVKKKNRLLQIGITSGRRKFAGDFVCAFRK